MQTIPPNAALLPERLGARGLGAAVTDLLLPHPRTSGHQPRPPAWLPGPGVFLALPRVAARGRCAAGGGDPVQGAAFSPVRPLLQTKQPPQARVWGHGLRPSPLCPTRCTRRPRTREGEPGLGPCCPRPVGGKGLESSPPHTRRRGSEWPSPEGSCVISAAGHGLPRPCPLLIPPPVHPSP